MMDNWEEVSVTDIPIGELPVLLNAILEKLCVVVKRRKSWGEVEFELVDTGK